MASGTVKWFNESKGFGFITPSEGGKDVFVHINEGTKSGLHTLSDGQSISFDVEQGRKGPQAVNLKG